MLSAIPKTKQTQVSLASPRPVFLVPGNECHGRPRDSGLIGPRPALPG